MTKWIDQSALDAAINRRRYSAFSPLHVASPSDPPHSSRQPAPGAALAFHIFINHHYSAYALRWGQRRAQPRARSLGRSVRARDAFPSAKLKRTMHTDIRSLQRWIKLQPARRLKRQREKRGSVCVATQKGIAISRVRLSSVYPLYGFAQTWCSSFFFPFFLFFLQFPSPPPFCTSLPRSCCSLTPATVSPSFGSRSSFPFTIPSNDSPLATVALFLSLSPSRALRHELTSRP